MFSWSATIMSRFVAINDGSGCSAICEPSSSASATNVSAPHTVTASPWATACSGWIQSDVKSARAACWRPIRNGRRKLLPASGATPIRVNGARSRAFSDISTRSQCSNIVNPMPTAAPFTAAMRGFGNDCSPPTKASKLRPAAPRSESAAVGAAD